MVLDSRDERPLTRYFPELIEPLRACLPERCVVDAELAVPGASGLDFDGAQQRIHPAASRQPPRGQYAGPGVGLRPVGSRRPRDLRYVALRDRRALLTANVLARSPVHLLPATTDPEQARTWFERFEGAGLDGIVAKRLDEPYRSGERTMIKVKHHRTCDCVVAGFRWHKDGQGIGSLLLGLFDDAGVLNHVGVCGSFTAKKCRELVEEFGAAATPVGRPSVEGVGRHDGPCDRVRSYARLAVALERGEGPLVGSRAARARLRGRVLAAHQWAVPPQRPLPAVATGSGRGQFVPTTSSRWPGLELGDVLG